MSDICHVVDEITAEMNLTPQGLRERFALAGLADEDFQRLAALQGVIAAAAPKLVSTFYQRLGAFVLHHGPQHSFNNLAILHSKMSQYLISLATGPYDEKYIRSRLMVGVAHQRSNVPPSVFVEAFAWFLGEVIGAIREHLSADSAAFDPIRTVSKMALFDLCVILEAYFHADHQLIEHMAHHDALTGLANEGWLREKLKDREGGDGCLSALALVGMNRFKAVNETLGREIGDRILREVGRRLALLEDHRNMVARMSSDTFAIVPPSCASAELTRDTVTKALDILQQPYEIDGVTIGLAATAGISANDRRPASPDILVRQCEVALRYAKTQQISLVEYDPSMERFTAADLMLLNELRQALSNHELVLYYQPKVDLRTGRPTGAEALVRWIHPTKGFMPPGQFIPLAEQTVLVHPITEYIMRSAIMTARRWETERHPIIVSVNIAAANLQNAQLPGFVEHLLAESGLSPSLLMLEITETGLLMDPKGARQIVEQFRRIGVKLAIDDFGMGYSSLAYLKNLSVDEVKIDQYFVFGMSKDEKDERIVAATINLAHSLGLEVCAEGIEDVGTYKKLKEYGCELGQGFYVSRPIPPEQFEVWLTDYEAAISPLHTDPK